MLARNPDLRIPQDDSHMFPRPNCRAKIRLRAPQDLKIKSCDFRCMSRIVSPGGSSSKTKSAIEGACRQNNANTAFLGPQDRIMKF